MSDSGPTVDPQQTLAALAIRFAGAARVFQRHGLDYCCHGQISLRDACIDKRLEPAAVVDELRRELRPTPPGERWDERPVPELIDHLLEHYHRFHRSELPRLLAMAQKVERVHAGVDTCPIGLAAHLHHVAGELDSHMQKEEQILFPMLQRGEGALARMPIRVMRSEHDHHGEALRHLADLTDNLTLPPDACNTWRALYLGLRTLHEDLMEHIHLENNVLFTRALLS